MNWSTISEHIQSATGLPFPEATAHPLGGGDINAAYRIQARGQSYFVKLNRAHLQDMFAAEQAGLQELAATGTVTVPLPITTGVAGEHAFLVLEYLNLAGHDNHSARLLGQQLAALHRIPQSYFGWHRGNTIGSTPQINTPADDWCDFWRNRRLGKQLQLAAQKGYSGQLQKLGERLYADLERLFDGYRPQPSLLHGDLWGGNWAVGRAGQAIIFDPACYYGDRETDLAMTELFGGFGADFYAAYQSAWPLDDGYKTRKTLYNLYHILNHLNLFGGGYLSQAEHALSKLLAELK